MNNTRHPSDNFTTAVWLALMALTLVTYNIGEAGLTGRGVMLALLLIVLFKGQMVAHYFMGLRQAGIWWRALVFGYLLVVGGLIALAYLAGLN